MNKQKIWDYFILSSRFLLAWTMLSYGWGKLSGEQFGITAAELEKPVNELSLFRLSWYLFDHEPFKSFIGISQIVSGLLLLFNRTALLGALLLLPIIANILVVNLTYLKMPPFYWRLSYYLLLDLLIFWHYKERILRALNALVSGLKTHFSYPVRAYLLLPVMAIAIELLGTLPPQMYQMIYSPSETLHRFSKTLDWAREWIGRLFT